MFVCLFFFFFFLSTNKFFLKKRKGLAQNFVSSKKLNKLQKHTTNILISNKSLTKYLEKELLISNLAKRAASEEKFSQN